MLELPLLIGATQVSATLSFLGSANKLVGASETLLGINTAVDRLLGPTPVRFVALTLKIYPKPFVSPVTVTDKAGEGKRENGDHVEPPSLENETV